MSQALIIATGTSASTTSFAVRPLNSIVYQTNPDGTAASFASLAANQITLLAGVYRIEGRAKATGAAADNVAIRLFNVTDAAVVANTDDAQQIAILNENVNLLFNCMFTLAGTKVFELQGKGSAANANGFGLSATFATNFAVIKITKTA